MVLNSVTESLEEGESLHLETQARGLPRTGRSQEAPVTSEGQGIVPRVPEGSRSSLCLKPPSCEPLA